jgi:AcrR family transcriptional regulator
VPINDLVAGENQSGAPLVRTEPVQERSSARIDALLDAAAGVVDEIGFDRLTTAMVAERAEASIGTVYRYFPDRIVLLQALRDRALNRYRQLVIAKIRKRKPKNWWDAVEFSIDAYVEMFRREKGFRIVRFTDVERASGGVEPEARDGLFAHQFAEILVSEFGLPGGDELNFRLEVVFEIADALITRAFRANLKGEQTFIDEARTIIREYLARRYGDGPVS